MYYGSGTDKRRAEFRDSVTIKTKTVDASPFVSAPPRVRRSATKDWGFGVNKFPINGRVWYPEGDGPFPLVLIVHGNHNPHDYSDPGTATSASCWRRAGSSSCRSTRISSTAACAARATGAAGSCSSISRLEALERQPGSPFYHKVDMNNIALMGHSRGGEAVGIAAAFNRLSHYPDDANVKFNFNFNIKSVFAIAPVDGQYQPAGVPTPIENVNYMVIPRLARRRRVRRSTGCGSISASSSPTASPGSNRRGMSIARTMASGTRVWGNKDNGPRSGRLLDLAD